MLKRAKSEVSQLKPKITKQLWNVIQSGALICAIVSPVLFRMESPRRVGAEIREITLPLERADRYLSSEVLHLPSPSDLKSDAELYYEFSAKQIRFESRASVTRVTASLGQLRSEEWRLVRIERVSPQGIRSASELFESEENGISSSFVELEEGENIYVATFRDSKRVEKRLRLRIKHLRTRVPS